MCTFSISVEDGVKHLLRLNEIVIRLIIGAKKREHAHQNVDVLVLDVYVFVIYRYQNFVVAAALKNQR